ncbi:MAG TPA: exosortase/archaeosortase family protein [Gemmataceae bacterium]|nr:exosortase/archaeosortase family protein [Gemmataceae bacterium]
MARADQPVTAARFPALLLLGIVTGLAAVVWAFWTTLGDAAERWAHDPQYSHGYLVPAFAALLLWLRRRQLDRAAVAPSWWGLTLLAGGVAARLAGVWFSLDWLEGIALIPCAAGVFVAAGGRAAWRWAWPAVLFLAFMIPLPHRVAVAAAGPLQHLATLASCYALQTLGLPAVPEGNTILLEEARIGIVEACSGLRMLVVFFALSSGVALVIRRPAWERLLLVASAVPIALFSNLVRITATGVLHATAGSDFANNFFHDVGGWLMMPFALALFWLELKVLARLLTDTAPAGPVRVGLPGAAAPARRAPWKKPQVA